MALKSRSSNNRRHARNQQMRNAVQEFAETSAVLLQERLVSCTNTKNWGGSSKKTVRFDHMYIISTAYLMRTGWIDCGDTNKKKKNSK